MKIGFHSNQLGLRGTEVALFDYAKFNQEVLGNESVIFYPERNAENEDSVLRKFSSCFKVLSYESFSQTNSLIEQEKLDAFYLLKAGRKNDQLVQACENVVHAVFPHSPKHRHGERYAYVSKWLSDTCSKSSIPFVPHIVHLPEGNLDLRKELSISSDATVVGGYGGSNSFDVPFAPAAILAALSQRKNLVFVFMNFDRFQIHDRVIFLPGSPDLQVKANFVEACDAMLHARLLGESFGLACGEFSIKNKPVITFGKSKHRSHLDILGEKALIYRNTAELIQLLLGLDRTWIKQQDWDCYSDDYNPRAIMTKFKSVFLDPQSPKKPLAKGWWSIFS